jgi:hypothetical protein
MNSSVIADPDPGFGTPTLAAVIVMVQPSQDASSKGRNGITPHARAFHTRRGIQTHQATADLSVSRTVKIQVVHGTTTIANVHMETVIP